MQTSVMSYPLTFDAKLTCATSKFKKTDLLDIVFYEIGNLKVCFDILQKEIGCIIQNYLFPTIRSYEGVLFYVVKPVVLGLAWGSVNTFIISGPQPKQ